jgi:hypothetical protein
MAMRRMASVLVSRGSIIHQARTIHRRLHKRHKIFQNLAYGQLTTVIVPQDDSFLTSFWMAKKESFME